jgi:peroxiredoxin Q/BCP
MMTMTMTTHRELTIGDPAPSFALEAGDGTVHRLEDYAGRWLVLYFYPRDNTPGCTREACDFRDASEPLSRNGVAVLGVSADSVSSHARFQEKYELSFPLLADPDKATCVAYGVWQEKVLYGKRSMGIVRSTFVIDPGQRVRNIYRKVRVNGHVEEVLEFLKSV